MICCPVCLTCATTPRTRLQAVALYECPSCHLLFNDPLQPPDGSSGDRSCVDARQRGRKMSPLPLLTRQEWGYRSFFSLHLNPGGRLLEVGCGTGAFLRLASQQGYRAMGIDHDPTAVRSARELCGTGDVRALSVEDLLQEPWDCNFDVICLFDVLEYLEDPVRVVAGLGGMLTTGGHIVCTVPGSRRWPRWFVPGVDSPPQHLTLWVGSALDYCFKIAGLAPVAVLSSPLLSDHLLRQASAQWEALQRTDAVGKALRAAGQFVVAPVVAGLLAIVPGAGGFTLMGVAVKSDECQS